jgi:hypothetical protein
MPQTQVPVDSSPHHGCQVASEGAGSLNRAESWEAGNYDRECSRTDEVHQGLVPLQAMRDDLAPEAG